MKNVLQARTRGRRFLRFLLTCASLLLVLMIFLILWSRGSVVVTRNLDYLPGTDYAEDKDKLDIFMPRGVSEVPVIVFFHGAGHCSEALASRIVPEGVGVVSANYRLSPSVMHPAHIQDAAAAFAWVIENIACYGGDPERVYVSGYDRNQIDSFGKAMRAAGNRDVHVVEVPNCDHSTLLTQMNTTDDQIGGLVLRFIRGWEENAPQQ